MPNEIDIAGLREDYKDFEGVEIPFHLHDAIRAIPALLDEVERLRGERETLNKLISMQQQAHIDGHAEIVAERDAALARVRELDAALDAEIEAGNEAERNVLASFDAVVAERDALKERLERLREWAVEARLYCSHDDVQAKLTTLFAILDGKEG